jgi:hypothetical protein
MVIVLTHSTPAASHDADLVSSRRHVAAPHADVDTRGMSTTRHVDGRRAHAGPVIDIPGVVPEHVPPPIDRAAGRPARAGAAEAATGLVALVSGVLE